MDSELPHCTVCLKPLAAGWRCPEHRDCDHYIEMRSQKLECQKCGAAYIIGLGGCHWEARP